MISRPHFAASLRELIWPTVAGYALLFAPIVLVARPLMDDNGRAVDGYMRWTDDGRPLGDALFFVLNFGIPSTATILLNQAIAILFLGMAGSIVGAMFRAKPSALTVASIIPLGGHPYFLENLSYLFDAPLMAAAVLLATGGAAATVILPQTAAIAFSVLLVLGAVNIYQPAINVYGVLMCCFAGVLFAADVAAGIRLVIASCVVLVCSGVTYYFTSFRLVADPYLLQHAEFSYNDTVITGLYNLATYWKVVINDWKWTLFTPFYVLIVIFGVASAIVSGQNSGRSQRSICACVTTVLIAIVLQFGVCIVLKNPVWDPRTFVSFGVVPCVLGLQIASFCQQGRVMVSRAGRVICAIPILCLAYGLFVVSSTTGSAALGQKEFEASLISRIIGDAESLSGEGLDKVAIVGASMSSPILDNASRKFPVVARIVQNALRDGEHWWWGYVVLKNAGLRLSSAAPVDYDPRIEGGRARFVKNAGSYMLFIDGKTLVVVFPTRSSSLPSG